jgi:hypothetical protein
VVWSNPIKVNASPSGVAAFTPSVDVSSDGTVAVTYYDFRNNTPSASTLPTDAFAVFSHDGGVTFGDEVRLTKTSFDLDLAPRAGGPLPRRLRRSLARGGDVRAVLHADSLEREPD